MVKYSILSDIRVDSPLYDLVRRLESDPGVLEIVSDSMGIEVWGNPQESLISDVRKLFQVDRIEDDVDVGGFYIFC